MALAPQIKIIHGAGAPKSKSNHKSDMGWRPKSKSFMALAPKNQIKSNRENHDFYTNACKLQAAPQRLRMLADVETKKAAVAAKAGLHR